MTTETTRMPRGLVFVLLGLASFLASRWIDGGFWRGLLLGITIALMVLGAYLIGTDLRGRTRESDGWVPSRDGRG